LTVLALCISTASVAIASESTLSVSAEQAVTAAGDFPSLKTFLEDICRLAAVELRAFEAADRAVTVSYAGVPLAEMFEGLLRQESYLVGVAPGPDEHAVRVRWLRVVGDGAKAVPSAPAAPAASAPPPPPVMNFEVPASFGGAEFASEDPEQRARALDAVATRLLETERLMASDPAVLAATLGEYPHARALLTHLRDNQENPELRVKLDAILAAMP
jgi:hypothetical protein